MSLNLAMMLREAARSHPQKPAVLFDGGSVSYAELDAATDRFAAGLRARGLQPGDSVGLQLPNVPQFLIAYYGILKAGCVVVPMNVLFKAGEIGYILEDSDARVFVTWAGSAEEAAKAAADAGIQELYVLALPGMPAPDVGRPFEQLLATPVQGRPPLYQSDPGDTAVIIYTSGTTGRPKGAELSHFCMFLNCDTPGRLFGIREDDIAAVALPLFHIYGQSSVMNLVIRFGGTMSLIPRFDATKVLEVIQRDRITVFDGVPTMFIALNNHPDKDKYDLSSMRVAVSGGAPIPAEVIDEFERTFGVVILEGYGLSETASTTSFNFSEEDRRVYSVGKAIYGVEVEIWDGQYNSLPRGKDHVGEVMIRGTNLLTRYHNNPEATAEAFTDGWFHTGDLGYIDDDGYIFIVDRKKDLIIRGGYNVYPREIEDVIYQHPAVAEAAVVGVPDDRLGQEIKAYVALRPNGARATEEEIIEFVKQRVASYKYPRSVEFREHLPMNATGKIVKREL